MGLFSRSPGVGDMEAFTFSEVLFFQSFSFCMFGWLVCSVLKVREKTLLNVYRGIFRTFNTKNVSWLIGSVGWCVGWLVRWLVRWLVGWLVGSFVGWLVSWLVAPLVDWLVGCATG